MIIMISTICYCPRNSGKQIKSMQYKFLRIVFTGSIYSRNLMLEKVGVERLERSRKIHLAGLIYKRAQDPAGRLNDE